MSNFLVSSASPTNEHGPPPPAPLETGALVSASEIIPLSVRIKEVVVNYFPLSCITFGGPQAHIALLLDLFVVKKKWLSEDMFTELYAISNALPGPASTQLAFTVALIRGGVIPGILAFLIWSIPGGIIMGAFGYGVGRLGASNIPLSVLYIERSLAAVSIALVVLAAKQLSSKLLVDKTTCSLAAIAIILVINFSSTAWLIPVIMVGGGIVTYLESAAPGWIELYKSKRDKKKDIEVPDIAPEIIADTTVENNDGNPSGASTDALIAETKDIPVDDSKNPAQKKDLRVYFSYSMATGAIVIAAFFILLIISVILRSRDINQPINILSTFYFCGAIIFGGGPVVVPLLYSYVVTGTAWLTSTEFLMGFAIINVMPGPNFNFAAYCGALAFRDTGFTTVIGALFAWIGIFLPGLLIKAGVLPIWRQYRDLPVLKIIFRGLNSVAVGLLIAAIYLLWQKAVALPENTSTSLGNYSGWTGVMVAAFLALDVWKVSSPLVVFAGAIVGALAWVIDGRPAL